MDSRSDVMQRAVRIIAGAVQLDADLVLPDRARGIVVFAHGSGSSRHSPRNRSVARELNEGGLGTLLLDLLTRDEEAIDDRTRHLRFDIGLLAERLAEAVAWASSEPSTACLAIGCFGASTGAAAALVCAAARPDLVRAVVSRGGRPDLAGAVLERVQAPTLLVVGEADPQVIDLNELAFRRLRCVKALEIVPRASHLFAEPGTLEAAAQLARAWFVRYLQGHGRDERTIGL